jgi:hypothetical protein
MKNFFYTIFIVYTMFFIAVQPLFAQENAGNSAQTFVNPTDKLLDKRPKVLKQFLELYNSPLAEYADVFVQEADKNNIDWRLVASIAGVESTFALHLPANSYNAWGWGIFGTNVHYFESYEDAIKTISKGLREDYMNKWKATNVYEIGRIYAASPTWAQRVTYFMNKIEEFDNKTTTISLSITL